MTPSPEHWFADQPRKLTGPGAIDRFAGWLGRSFDYGRWTVTVVRVEHDHINPKIALVIGSAELRPWADDGTRYSPSLSGGIAVLFVSDTGEWLSTSMTIKYGPRNDETALWTTYAATDAIEETGAEMMPDGARAGFRFQFARLADVCRRNLSR